MKNRNSMIKLHDFRSCIICGTKTLFEYDDDWEKITKAPLCEDCQKYHIQK